jgi:hypothetical protein
MPWRILQCRKYELFIPTPVAGEIDEWHVYVNPYTGQVLGKHLIKKAKDIFPSAFIPFVFPSAFCVAGW